jgi:hypothetical protein
MKTVNLVLRFKLINEPRTNVRHAARIKIDGAGRLRVWDVAMGEPETITLRDIESMSIEPVIDSRKVA